MGHFLRIICIVRVVSQQVYCKTWQILNSPLTRCVTAMCISRWLVADRPRAQWGPVAGYDSSRSGTLTGQTLWAERYLEALERPSQEAHCTGRAIHGPPTGSYGTDDFDRWAARRTAGISPAGHSPRCIELVCEWP